MADHYFYQLQPANALLKVTDELGPFNTWQKVGDSGKLVVSSGFVATGDDGQVLHSGPPDNVPVVTLAGASWQSTAGDSGSGTCHLCTGTPGPQSWVLERVE